MNHEKKIHLLAQELIPIINELDEAPKLIVLDHVKTCNVCKETYQDTLAFDDEMPKLQEVDQIELKPLKKLAQYNLGLKIFLFAVRAIILFYIAYLGIAFVDASGVDVSFVQSAIFLFYIPAVIFLLIFTYTFFEKKWLWTSLLIDGLIILFFSKLVEMIFS